MTEAGANPPYDPELVLRDSGLASIAEFITRMGRLYAVRGPEQAVDTAAVIKRTLDAIYDFSDSGLYDKEGTAWMLTSSGVALGLLTNKPSLPAMRLQGQIISEMVRRKLISDDEETTLRPLLEALSQAQNTFDFNEDEKKFMQVVDEELGPIEEDWRAKMVTLRRPSHGLLAVYGIHWAIAKTEPAKNRVIEQIRREFGQPKA